MHQSTLFHETIYDALTADVMAVGGFKKVAGMLYPAKPINSAYAYLKNALREDTREKLDGEEIGRIIALAAAVDSFATVNHYCDGAHLTRPHRLDPEDEKAELQRAYVEIGQELLKVARRLEKADQRSLREAG